MRDMRGMILTYAFHSSLRTVGTAGRYPGVAWKERNMST